MRKKQITFGGFLDRLPKSTRCVCVIGVAKTIAQWRAKEKALALLVERRCYLRPYRSWSVALRYPGSGQTVGEELRYYMEKTDRLFVIRKRERKNLTTYLKTAGYCDNASFAGIRFAKVYSDYELALVDLYPVKIHHKDAAFDIVEIDAELKAVKGTAIPSEGQGRAMV